MGREFAPTIRPDALGMDAAAAHTRAMQLEEPAQQDDEVVHLARSPLARALWIALGFVCIAVGAIGVVLPGLPTTPFLVLAAACFVRGSERLYRRLLAHERFGPLIRDFRAGLGIPARIKLIAIATMVVFVGFAVGPGLPAGRWDLRAIVLVTAGIGVAYLLSLPNAPRREQRDEQREGS